MGVVIEKIALGNVLLLQDISKQTFIDSFASQNTEENITHYVENAFSTQKLEIELKNKSSEFYFLLIDSEAVAYMKINFSNAQSDIKEEDAMEVERIYVHVAHQNLKLGTSLLDFAVKRARQESKKYIWLGVWEKNSRAISFYERYGFNKFSSHIYPIGDDPQIDWLLRLDIEN